MNEQNGEKRERLLYSFPHIAYLGSFLKWLVLGGIVGILAGSASALFLHSLDYVTQQRISHPWLLFLLPVGGALVSYMYMRFGGSSSRGNNLILEGIQNGGETIPLRMAPLVLLGTLITHLFGGSAGREGTAVQMGGSLAEWFGKMIKIDALDRRILLMCGVSGGFGSVFGTPLAGTVFGLEVIAIGLMSYRALIPCFAASFIGDIVATHVWGVHHTSYSVDWIPPLSVGVVLKVLLASVIFGLVSLCFSELTHFFKRTFSRVFKNPIIKSAVGGAIVIALVYIAGSRDYLGLGIPLITSSLTEGVSPFAFLWKLLFTSITLGSGFQGGEVTPLFVIGSTLGHSLASLLHIYGPFLAALGFIAVFSGATSTPIACFIMGVEIFGSEGALYMFMACIVSYVFSGHTGIYSSQQIGMSKSGLLQVDTGSSLEDWKNTKKTKKKAAQSSNK
ncbi:voltage-gated chloride channel protein [Paenibacillus sp. 79R4]|nr:voltage-gated chloride channel protein [Paenibacillus sp. 79R4]